MIRIAKAAVLALVLAAAPAPAVTHSGAQTATPVPAAAQPDPFGDIADSAENSFEIQQKIVVVQRGWPSDFIEDSWRWHLLSTKIIFCCVIVVVMFGLFVSWLQFREDINLRSRLPHPSEPGGAEEPTSSAYDFAASLNSVSIKSKTIGALVLVFSGVFFFLYLKFVYPVTVVNEDSSSPPAAASPAD